MAGRGGVQPPQRRGGHAPSCCCCCCCCCNGARSGGLQPSAVFLLGTLALTSAATALLAAAIMTDRWEEIHFDPETVKAVARRHNNASRGTTEDMMDAVTTASPSSSTTSASTVPPLFPTSTSTTPPPPLPPGAVRHTLSWLFGGAAVKVTITRGPPVIPGVNSPQAMPLRRTSPLPVPLVVETTTMMTPQSPSTPPSPPPPPPSPPPPTVVPTVTTSTSPPLSEAATEVGWLSHGPPSLVSAVSELTSPVSVTSDWTGLVRVEGGPPAATRVKRRTHGSYVHRQRRDSVVYIFLVPMHGGIWTLCVSLNDEERQTLREMGFMEPHCTNYLSPEAGRTEEARTDWQHRMQNLSISCALVCLIILGSSALVGAFGVLQHQISAVLVTGVMYLLAATFATFTLAIMHFKRRSKKGECVVPVVTAGSGVDGGGAGGPAGASVAAAAAADTAPAEYAAARVFSTGWSLDLGWAGVVLCVLASALWILLSKIMRYSPLSFPAS
ncbi:uncharacterized protein LOC124165887 [Ischnura elegans]|uniref:uncharacterized protein LOC124165887 n=1 Tax=Ischnura elegans TaxID=197161 RepID=UPI001ED86D68|nr:uncharacterized protein LOC124165887 [Ischnura elegans]